MCFIAMKHKRCHACEPSLRPCADVKRFRMLIKKVTIAPCVNRCRWVEAGRVDYNMKWGLYSALALLAPTSGATMAICDATTVRHGLAASRTIHSVLH